MERRAAAADGRGVIRGRAAVLAGAVALLLSGGLDAQEAPLSADDADARRGLRPADLFRIEEVGRVRVSPDGEVAAFERVRAGDNGERQRLSLFDGTRSDVRVAPLDGGEVIRVAEGGETDTGWFRPRWSPDGERLALLSVRGEEIRPWVWSRSTGELRQLSDRAVHTYLGRPLLFAWTGPRTLAFAASPEGRPRSGRMLAEDMRPGARAIRQWRRSWSGRRSTASVLDAGVEDGESALSPRKLVAVDVADGGERVVARGRWGHLDLSPDARRAVAFGFSGLGGPPAGRPVPLSLLRGTRPATLEIEAGGTRRRPALELDDPMHGTLSWAPDGRHYALLDRTHPAASARGRADRRDREDHGAGPEGAARGETVVVRVSVDGSRRVLTHPEREVTGLAWSGDARLLVRARPTERGGGEAPRARWWRVTRSGDWAAVTGEGEPAPTDLYPAGDGALVGVAEGELWRIAPNEEARSLTREFAPAVQRVVWPAPAQGPVADDPGRRRTDDPLVVAAGRGEDRGLWIVDPGREDAAPVRLPAGAPGAELEAFSPETRTGVVLEADSTGTRLAAVRPDDGWAEGPTLFRANRWIERIRAGETRQFTYTGREGRELTGWLLLPVGHREGDRPPLVTWMYPGLVHGARPAAATRPGRASPVASLQLLAARGYAVLMPSMPLPPPGGEIDVRARLLDGVLPAVDSALAMDLADPGRLGVMGQSYGGYAVYHAVSLTDRFRAAIASAGPTDLVSFYGTFDRRARYGHMHHPLLGQVGRMGWVESGQGRMRVPPWEAPDRYRRNSPIAHVDEVETPLLMMHGDMDFVPLQQAESFFTALQRQGKRARLVRYFGEGHTAFGRANVLDQWSRVFDWLGEHLGEPG